MITHTGSCHCGRVRFEVIAPPELTVTDCDCSICSKSGYLHLLVPKSRFKLLCGEDALTTYQFNTRTAKHCLFRVRHQGVLRAAVASGGIQRQRALFGRGHHRADDGGPIGRQELGEKPSWWQRRLARRPGRVNAHQPGPLLETPPVSRRTPMLRVSCSDVPPPQSSLYSWSVAARKPWRASNAPPPPPVKVLRSDDRNPPRAVCRCRRNAGSPTSSVIRCRRLRRRVGSRSYCRTSCTMLLSQRAANACSAGCTSSSVFPWKAASERAHGARGRFNRAASRLRPQARRRRRELGARAGIVLAHGALEHGSRAVTPIL